MLALHISVWVNAIASLMILLASLRLYQEHHLVISVRGRIVLASIGSAAISSAFEILAWRQPIPMGMTAFLLLLAVLWVLRAFCPEFMREVLPTNTGVRGVAGMSRADTSRDEMARATRYPAQQQRRVAKG